MTRRLKTRTAWIAILAVLFHALIPLAHASAGSGGFMSVLCSVDGQKSVFVPVGLDHQDSRHSLPGDMLFKCPLCVAGAHFALTGDTTLTAGSSRALSHVLTSFPRPAYALSALRLHFSPRAPPLA